MLPPRTSNMSILSTTAERCLKREKACEARSISVNFAFHRLRGFLASPGLSLPFYPEILVASQPFVTVTSISIIRCTHYLDDPLR